MNIPPTWKEIQILLGQANYQRHNIKDFYLLTSPLIPFAREIQFAAWTVEAEEAFYKLDSILRQH